MSSVYVVWNGINKTLEECTDIRKNLSSNIAAIRSIKANRYMTGKGFTEIYKALDTIICRLDNNKSNLKKLEDALFEVSCKYKNHEKLISDNIKSSKIEINKDESNVESFTWKDAFSWSNSNTLDLLSKAGIIGSGLSTIGRIIFGGWTTKSIIKAGKDLLTSIGGISSTMAKGSEANWWRSLSGFNDGLAGLDTSSAGKTFVSSLQKQFGKDLSFESATAVGDKIKVATKWGGYGLTLASNYFENKAEFEGQDNSTDRMLKETVIETVVDIGVGAVATATVSAAASALVSAGVITAAPAIAIGAGAVLVTWAANGVCKWVTGDEKSDIGEVAADIVCTGWDIVSNWSKSIPAFT